MEALKWITANADKIGVIALLMIVCAGLIWIAKKLYEQGRACELARLQDAKERSDMNLKLGKLSSKVETLETMRDINHLNHQTLLDALSKNK